ncbi:GreA/GreB family elongation factor [Microbacterium horticulturae]|uniref:GreA/GreB family elongation factor n=1 Tax=Microbacterium horticulturae TaxID=3028316 RepID=A0ABY8C2S7_9MICO|nr:GreA/GreB family elongation factor [Microbacterium sp. KACC 23027]WEG09361.1 GreA/GreB family elongation factor [Microbacterium sp. KACC 23027]
MTDVTGTAQTVWMTPAALAALQAELEQLTAAGDEAAQARVLELRDLIRRAEVGTKPDDGVVEQGMRITVKFHVDDSVETFLLGSRDLVQAGADIDVYSPSSPLGSAIDGRHVGDEVSYTAPNGAQLTVTIIAATPFA